MRKHVVHDLMGNVLRIEEIPDNVDPREFMKQAIHDCPECRAAMERGEQPRFATSDELAAINAPRRHPFAKPPRWRTRKRR